MRRYLCCGTYEFLGHRAGCRTLAPEDVPMLPVSQVSDTQNLTKKRHAPNDCPTCSLLSKELSDCRTNERNATLEMERYMGIYEDFKRTNYWQDNIRLRTEVGQLKEELKRLSGSAEMDCCCSGCEAICSMGGA